MSFSDEAAQQAWEQAEYNAANARAETERRQTVWNAIIEAGPVIIQHVCNWALGQGITEEQLRLWFYREKGVVVEYQSYQIELRLDGSVALQGRRSGSLPGFGFPPMSAPGGFPAPFPGRHPQLTNKQSPESNVHSAHSELPDFNETAIQEFMDIAVNALAESLHRAVSS